MARYQYVVLTNPVEGRDDEYNEWYTNTHLKEILQIPGFKAASRYKIAARPDAAATAPKHRYLALYEMETNDVEATLAELRRRSAAGEIVSCPALDRSQTSTTLFELIAERDAG